MLRITEKILIHQVKSGREFAFTKFYELYRDKIYRFIYFKVSDEEKANDLTNETFLKIFNYLKEEGEIENFQAFLFKIARNLIIDFYRTRQNDLSLDEAIEIAAPQETEKQLDQKMAIDNIKKYLSLLKPEYREVVEFHFFQGLSFKETSEIIGEKESNVRQRVHRGLDKLKEILKDKEEAK
ncbi:MAG: RNA polymerase sigma factor [Patescibacteria group bacterium]|nr:RNA polymerase sigma factor [Patescibacteria group bacterium]MDD5164318.1 RNA polymerase sigma factor [Patescibacteria group bacterium]MDD5534764.1 RNA polymerase sigma factor [Patescibacteria group bacterium]